MFKLEMKSGVDAPKCSKQCYISRKEAKKSMKNINKTKHHGLTNSYFCEECQSWHLTSIGKQRSRDWTRHLKKQK